MYAPDAILSDLKKMEMLVDQAWHSLSWARRQQTCRSEIARRLIKRAAQGEHDPARLRAYAVLDVIQGGKL